MSQIKGRDTMPEIAVRSMLHRMGYRFRANVKSLPGRPDIVLRRYETVVMVHGCFWHRHKSCRFAYQPKSRRAFWGAKFRANVERDVLVKRELAKLGWRVVTVWECELRKPEKLARRLDVLLEKQGKLLQKLK
jgi:DNA mismatch endonuclease (patch repair protein)